MDNHTTEIQHSDVERRRSLVSLAKQWVIESLVRTATNGSRMSSVLGFNGAQKAFEQYHGSRELHEVAANNLRDYLDSVFAASSSEIVRSHETDIAPFRRLIVGDTGNPDGQLTVITQYDGEPDYRIQNFSQRDQDGNRNMTHISTQLNPHGFLEQVNYHRPLDNIVEAVTDNPIVNLLGACAEQVMLGRQTLTTDQLRTIGTRL